MADPHRVLVVGEQWFGATPRGVADGLRRLGHEVETVDPRDVVFAASGLVLRAVRRGLMPLLAREHNRQVVEAARRFHPDVTLVVKGPFLRPETLRSVRREGARIYNYYPDVSVFAFGGDIPRVMPEYDHVFTTKSFHVERLGSWLGPERVTFLPHGYSPDVHRRLALSESERREYATDVGYVGNYSPHKEQSLAEIKARLPSDIQLTIRGNGWSNCSRPELRGSIRGGPVEGWAYAKAIRAAKVNVAIHYGIVECDGVGDLMSTRSFEIPACGGMMLHERNDETEDFFVDGREVALFDGLDEAADKIRHFLANPELREAVARSGHERCVPVYSYDQRMASLLRHHERMTEAVPS